MKRDDKLAILKMLRKCITFKDGFFIFKDGTLEKPLEFEEARKYIRSQQTKILEEEISFILDELRFNKNKDFNVREYFKTHIKSKAKKGESLYFKSLDYYYPNNKLRQIMNYYLFHDEHYCFILEGFGQTGKSTFVNVLALIFGIEYFGRSSVSLIKNQHGTTMLEGKMLFELSESQDLDHNTANTLKDIITQDLIYINPKFQQQRMIQPHCRVILSCNNLPKFKTTDDGILRRFIPYLMNCKIESQTPALIDDLIKQDLPYIIYEAIQHPFNINDFAIERHAIFRADPQYGYECGPESIRKGGDYYNYKEYCRESGFYSRSLSNYNLFIELEEIYRSRFEECDITLKDAKEKSGLILSKDLGLEELPF